MNSGFKTLLRTVGAIAGLFAASLAHADGSVYYSVNAAVAPGVNLGVTNVPPQPVYVQPAPVLVAPQPVYVQPQAVYVQPPAYVVEYAGQGRREHWRREHEHQHDRGHHEHDEHGRHGHDD